MRPHLWVWWSEIAIDQERLARNARKEALLITTSGEGFGEALGRETRASLIAVSASAHALDGLYGVVSNIIAPVVAQSRWSSLLETFKAAFQVRGPAGGGGWASEFKWLFRHRDAAVHHPEETRESVPHPTGTTASWANYAYSLESAERAVDLLLEVLETGVTSPRPPLAHWARDFAPSVRDLRETRNSV